MLGCSGEVGEAVHGGGWRAWCWGHQHRQMWHLRQVPDDACERGGGWGLGSHWGGEEPGLPLADRTTRQEHRAPSENSTAPCSLLGAHPRSECRLLTAPPPLLPSPEVEVACRWRHCIHCCAPFACDPRPSVACIQSPLFEIPSVTSFKTTGP